MANLHSSGPDTLAELESWSYDLLPACIVSSTWPVAPGSGLTIGAFSTQGYVRKGSLLYYVDQPARAITLPSVDGTYYLALTTDTHGTVGSFTRVAGSHYAYLQSASAPTYPDGSTPIASAVVSGGNITTVDTTPALTPPLSRQTADAVAITGGTAVLSTLGVSGLASLTGQVGAGTSAAAGYPLLVGPGSTVHQSPGKVGINVDPTYDLDVTGTARLTGMLGLGMAPTGFDRLQILHNQAVSAVRTQPSGEQNPNYPVVFVNAAGGTVGHITQTATAVAYNSISDRRLKRNVTPLADALATVRQLRPVSYLWNADDSPGHGFLAHEAQQVIPEAVTGLPDEVNDDGTIRPQGIDLSKLVPWLTGAVQEIAQRLDAIESALGL